MFNKLTGKIITQEYFWKNLGEDGLAETTCNWGVNNFQCNSDNAGKIGWADRNMAYENGYWIPEYWMSNVKCRPWDSSGIFFGEKIYKYQCSVISAGEEDIPVSEEKFYSENLLENSDFEIGKINQGTFPLFWNKNYWNDSNAGYNLDWTSWGKGAVVNVIQNSEGWVGIRSDLVYLEKNKEYLLNGLLYCDSCSDKSNFVLTLHVGRKNYPGTAHYTLLNSEIKEKYSYGYDKTEINLLTNNEDDLFAYVIIAFKPNNVGKGYADNIGFKKVLTAEEYKQQETPQNDNEISSSQEQTPTEDDSLTNNPIESSDEETIENTGYSVSEFSLSSLRQEPFYKISGEEDLYDNSLTTYKNSVILYKDIGVIKERLDREPYSSWYEEIKKTADEALNPSDVSNFKRIEKAKYAKLTAFVYAVTGEKKYGDASKNLLILINNGTYNTNNYEDVDGLVWISEAYDILKGANYDFGNSKDCKFSHNCHRVWTFGSFGKVKCDVSYDCNFDIRNKIFNQMVSLSKSDINDIISQPENMLARNNLHIRRYSAVGIAAIALQDKNYLDIAINKGIIVSVLSKEMDYYDNDGVADVIKKQLVHNWEGGWAEGPYYMRYTFVVAIPFMKAMENAGMENNWLDSNKLKNLFDWGVKIRMPNGARPPFDDSNIDESYFFGGYIDDPVQHWDWINSEKSYYSNYPPATYLVDAISYYDDFIPAEEPELNPTLMIPDAGQIIFRSGWGEEDVYLAFLGENGKAIDDSFAGNTHEHDDSMSFILYAYGEYLAIDSGYINYENRDKVNKAKNHNVVLINNQVNTESFIQENKFFTSENLDYGEIKDVFNNKRGILFVDKEYFLVFDSLSSSYKNNEYSLIIHGNGLLSQETFIKSDFGGEWIQPNANLLTYTPHNAGELINYGNMPHSEEYGKINYHTALSLQRSGKTADYITLLYPSQDKNYPKISSYEFNGVDVLNLEKDDWEAKTFVNPSLKQIELNLSANLILTDSSEFFVKSQNGEIKTIFVEGCKKLSINNQEIIISDVQITGLLKFEGSDVSFYSDYF